MPLRRGAYTFTRRVVPPTRIVTSLHLVMILFLVVSLLYWVPLGAPSAPSGLVDAAPIRAILVPAAPSSLIAVTTLSINANAFAADLVEDVDDEAADGDQGLSDVFAVDDSGRVHVSENVLLGDENDMFATGISHAVAVSVKVAPSFDAIEEWLAENKDSEVPVHEEPPVKIPAKRCSSGSDPSRVK
ncbi:hypothetical protein V6N13_024952 [Hibiscus sabdariffa]|uniref:Uncharacterized protein n=2 Tax=Hibiscus sabdariffa TaxID=183260 RepID=A0ABR2BJA4_9ROSI